MPDDRRALGDPRLGLPDVNIVAAAQEFHLVAGRCHGTSNATRRTAAIAGLAGPSGRLWRGASRGLRYAHEESARRGQGLPWIHRRDAIKIATHRLTQQGYRSIEPLPPLPRRAQDGLWRLS